MNSNFEQMAFTETKKNLKSWANVQLQDLKFTKLAGLTNITMKIEIINEKKHPCIEPKIVVFRSFVENEGLTNLIDENYIFKLITEAKLGPICYAQTNEYRIEQFLFATHPTRAQIQDLKFKRKIMLKLTEFHDIKPENIPKEPLIDRILEQKQNKTISQFLAQADKKQLYKQSQINQIEEIKRLTSSEEINFVKSLLPQNSNKTQFVNFTHNDLHQLNIFIETSTQKIILIDYDYSAYNYFFQDIGNYANETMFDYEKADVFPFYEYKPENFPNQQEIQNLATYYYFFKKFKQSSYQITKNGQKQQLSQKNLEQIIENQDLLNEIVNNVENANIFGKIDEFKLKIHQLTHYVYVGSLLSHYFYSLWSIIMFEKSQLPNAFDYIEYGYLRFKLYLKLKQQLEVSQLSKI